MQRVASTAGSPSIVSPNRANTVSSGFPFPKQPASVLGSDLGRDHEHAVQRVLQDMAEANMNQLVHMVSDLSGWKPVLTHKSGAVVYRRTKVARNETVPIFMGVGVIRNCTPETIFTLVKSRSLWDEWYQEGHLVEKIDDSTFLSYMVIKAISKAIASHRDLALLEHREVDPVTGTIRIVSSSVETPKIPPVPTRVRAHLKLNGWILDPQVSSDGRVSTRVSYIIQSDVKGMVPSGLAKRYLARRALVVVWLDDYLRKYGPPPVHARRNSASVLSGGSSTFGDDTLSRNQTVGPISPGPQQQYQLPPLHASLNRDLEDEFLRRPSLEDMSQDQERAYNSELIDAEEDKNGFDSDEEENIAAALSGKGETLTVRPKSIALPSAASSTPSFHRSNSSHAPSPGSAGFDFVEDEDSDASAVPSSQISTHKHTEAGRTALEMLRGMRSADGWDAHSQADGITITTKPVEGVAMPMVRGDGLIEGPWTVLEVLSIIKSFDARTTWDARFESGRMVEAYNLDEALTYTQQKGTFPVSGRDLCTVVVTDYDKNAIAEDGYAYLAASSVTDSAVPEDPKRVRAFLTLAGWILKRVQGGVQATYIVQVDIKGTIPSSLLKMLQAQTPRAIKEIQSYLNNYGPLPFLVRECPDLEASKNIVNPTETYDSSSRRSSRSFTWENASTYGGTVSFCLPSRLYPHGADIELTVRPSTADSAVQVRKAVQARGGPAWMEKVGSGTVIRISVNKSALPQGTDHLEIRIDAKPTNAGFVCKGKPVADETIPVPKKEPVQQQQRPQLVSPARGKPVGNPLDTFTVPPPPKTPVSPLRTQKSPDSPQRASPPPPSKQELPAAVEQAPFVPPPFPTPSPHRHAKTATKALDLLKSLEPLTGWDTHSQADGISITTRPVDGAAMPMVRGDGTIEGPWSLHEALSVIRSMQARQVWDPRFEGGKVLETFNANESLTYTMQKGTFPVSGRDLACVTRIEIQEGVARMIAASVVDDAAPEDPKRVRAFLTLAGWVLKKVAGGIQATYIVQVDIKGTIPTSLLKALQAQTPRAIKEIQNYLTSHGPLPSIVRGGPKLGFSPNVQTPNEEYNAGSKTLSIDFQWAQPKTYAGTFAIFLPASCYPMDAGAVVDLTVRPSSAEEAILVRRAIGAEAKEVGSGRVVLISIDAKKLGKDAGDVKVAVVIKPKVGAGGALGFAVIRNGSPCADFDPAATPAPAPAVRAAPVNAAAKPVAAAAQGAAGTAAAQPSAPATKTVAKPGPPKPPAYIPHRHTESGVRALKLLKALFTDESMWTVETEDQRGVRISTIEMEGNQMPIVRGDAVFPPEWSAEDIITVIKNVGARKIWDRRFDDGIIKEWLNPNEFIFQAWLKSSKPQEERDVCGLHVSIYDSSSQTHYVMLTSVQDPLVPVDPRRLRAQIAVAGWIVRPTPQTPGVTGSRPGMSVTYIVKVDTMDENTRGAFPKIQSYLIALEVAEVLSYLESFGVPMSAKILGNTGEGLRVTLINERFDHGAISLFLDYFVSSALGPGEEPMKNGSGFAGMVEVNIDPRMCPAGVDVVFEGVGGGASAKYAVDVRLSPDRKVLRLYPKVDEIHSAGELRVRAMIRARDPRGPKEFTVEGNPAAVVIDRSNKVGAVISVAGGKKAAAATATSKVPTSPTSPTAPVASPTEDTAKPSPAPSTKTSNAVTKPVATPSSPKPNSSSLPAQPRSVPVAIAIALLSLILTILQPVIGGKASDPKTPLDPVTLFTDASPVQLTAVLVGGSLGTLVFFQLFLTAFFPAPVSSLLFVLFSPLQWVVLLAIAAVSVFVGASMRK
ncbi:hypothetical protein HDU96_005697 [Phlyctochytrium bullatum]|nr:hypothetical protein HDU96_005697 [Phlyctochytrium bullatum]